MKLKPAKHIHTPLLLVLVTITVWCLALPNASFPILAQGGEWGRGNVVGLKAGTCIREGPGFSYRAHTRVPEDNWAVVVIDGPRTADSHIWWDTSRRAAGDPSGGTGWVTQDQSDTDCGQSVQSPSLPQLPMPPSVPPPSGILQQLLGLLQRQNAVVKLAIAVLALLVLRVIWRSLGHLVMSLIGAVISAIGIYILMDLARSLWLTPWQKFAQQIFGANPPDLALVLALLPLASWLFVLLRKLIG